MLWPLQRSILPGLGRSGLCGLTIGLALGLAGCSSTALVDRLPGDMGLPAGTPERPVAPYQYPAVHDMPPQRATEPMSEDEQVRMEKELQTVRDRQEAREAPVKKPGAEKKKKAAPAVKKKPPEAKNGEADGAKTSGTKTNP